MIVTNRNRFGEYLDRMGYSTAVEVGVDIAAFSRTLLQTSAKLSKLYCVDPYLPYPEIPHERETARTTALRALKEFEDRYEFIYLSSVEASGVVPGQPDFVYVDGAHDEVSVWTDLNLWYGKLRGGGTLAGHDFDLAPVRDQVLRFASKVNIPLVVVPADGDRFCKDKNGAWAHPSYYMVKP